MSLLAKYPRVGKSGPCQSPEMLEATSPYPRILTRLRLAKWYARREGIASVLRRVACVVAPSMMNDSRADAARALALVPRADERLNLRPGEWIEVKSKEEILETLDDHGKNRGLRFVPEMFDFCGRRFRVLKRVEKICIENTPDVRSIRNTVLLENGICQGGGIGCDRACFHFWREIWLRRAAASDYADQPQLRI